MKFCIRICNEMLGKAFFTMECDTEAEAIAKADDHAKGGRHFVVCEVWTGTPNGNRTGKAAGRPTGYKVRGDHD